MSQDSTVLVLGASGMLGNAVLRYFSSSPGYSVIGAVRSSKSIELFPKSLRDRIIPGLEVSNADYLLKLFDRVRPAVVINCVGVVKQLAISVDPIAVIPVNSILPHRLLLLCKLVGARLVHISTDCVFLGIKGMYREGDVADASDLYGRSKVLGELDESPAVTLRTSIIGPELNQAHGLLGWLMAQRGIVKGFTRALFSGLPTVELARVMRDFVVPRPDLRGVYHVSSERISKYELLSLISTVYELSINIEPDANLVVDRSLDSRRFSQQTGYVSPTWPELVHSMREFG